MERVLVTGGAGFIGSHLVEALVKQGNYVRVLDNVSTGRVENLEPFGRKIDFVEGDIRNAVACRNASRGMDTVVHLAAMVSVPQTVQDPIQSDAINGGGTLNMLIAARDNGIKRLVFASSSAIYGDTDVIPTPETVLPMPTSPYGVQKLMGEHYARNFSLLYRLETVALRFFNVYGPRQNPNSAYAAAIPKLMTRLIANEAPIIFGDGEQTRDFCHVRDVASAIQLAAQTENRAAIGQTFNIAVGTRISLNDLMPMMQQVTGKNIAAQYDPPRPGDIVHSGADIRKAQEALGFAPQVTLADGLKEVAAYYESAR